MSVSLSLPACLSARPPVHPPPGSDEKKRPRRTSHNGTSRTRIWLAARSSTWDSTRSWHHSILLRCGSIVGDSLVSRDPGERPWKDVRDRIFITAALALPPLYRNEVLGRLALNADRIDGQFLEAELISWRLWFILWNVKWTKQELYWWCFRVCLFLFCLVFSMPLYLTV